MTKTEKIKCVQGCLEVKQDGHWGPLSQAAFDTLIHGKPGKDVHKVIASSFADPRDIRAFEKCKAEGKTDQQCFKVGDNGIGYMGEDTTEGSGPCCALPPEDMVETWGSTKEAHLQEVEVNANNMTVVCLVKDRMPARKNIKNGAGLDLNPDACWALGINPPVMTPATWQSMT